MDAKAELSRVAEELQRVDDELLAILERRANAVRDYRRIRDSEPDTYMSLPSAVQVVQRLLKQADAYPRESLEVVLREVVGACGRLISPIRVAVVGPEGSFSEYAAQRQYGSGAEIVSLKSIAEVFDEVERKRSSYGVIPFETSTEGALTDTLDALVEAEARICAEVNLPNSYDLVSRTGNAADIESVLGTTFALAACEATLRRDYPKATLLDVRSGPHAAQLVAEDHGVAALIVARDGDPPHALRPVQRRVEDRTGVVTRYVIIGHERPAKTGQDRTMLALAVSDDPGSLYTSLQPLADRGVNLTRIESRPAKIASWRYIFIVELDGHITDRSVLTAVDEVRAASRHLKVLGSYPRPDSG